VRKLASLPRERLNRNSAYSPIGECLPVVLHLDLGLCWAWLPYVNVDKENPRGRNFGPGLGGCDSYIRNLVPDPRARAKICISIYNNNILHNLII